MQTLKSLFKQNEWGLIQEVLNTKRKDNEGKVIKWITLAEKHKIRPNCTSKQKRVRANDIWRRYLKLKRKITPKVKILIYDIETARVLADIWCSGKQYISGNQIVSDSKIITIAYKWLGSDKVHYLKWDKNQSDKNLIINFLKEYNEADMVIGFNNDSFDNRYINARALKYNLEVNTFVKSFDIMKQAKRLFRLNSYSMNYIAKYIGVETKLEHTGIKMWKDIQYGNKKEAKEAMQLMINYNIQDILVTEQVYLKLRKYMKNPIHLGILEGNDKTSCPVCGSKDVKLYKTIVTTAGTIQRIMKCNSCKSLYKLSNSQYLKTWRN